MRRIIFNPSVPLVKERKKRIGLILSEWKCKGKENNLALFIFMGDEINILINAYYFLYIVFIIVNCNYIVIYIYIYIFHYSNDQILLFSINEDKIILIFSFIHLFYQVYIMKFFIFKFLPTFWYSYIYVSNFSAKQKELLNRLLLINSILFSFK